MESTCLPFLWRRDIITKLLKMLRLNFRAEDDGSRLKIVEEKINFQQPQGSYEINCWPHLEALCTDWVCSSSSCFYTSLLVFFWFHHVAHYRHDPFSNALNVGYPFVSKYSSWGAYLLTEIFLLCSNRSGSVNVMINKWSFCNFRWT